MINIKQLAIFLFLSILSFVSLLSDFQENCKQLPNHSTFPLRFSFINFSMLLKCEPSQ